MKTLTIRRKKGYDDSARVQALMEEFESLQPKARTKPLVGYCRVTGKRRINDKGVVQ